MGFYSSHFYNAHYYASQFYGGNAPTSPPGPVSFTIVDHEDGTGATVTITGDDDSTHTVFVEYFDQTLGGGPWYDMGSIEGSGDVVLDLPPGHYLIYVLATNINGNSITGVVYFAVTDDVDSIHYRCCLAVQTRIRAAALTGVDFDSVVVQKLPLGRAFLPRDGGPTPLPPELSLPGIIVSPVGSETRDAMGHTNAQDNNGYPVMVTILAADNQELDLTGRELRWREQITRAFNKQRLPGVREVLMIRIETSPVIVPESWINSSLWHSSLIIRCEARENRGLGA